MVWRAYGVVPSRSVALEGMVKDGQCRSGTRRWEVEGIRTCNSTLRASRSINRASEGCELAVRSPHSASTCPRALSSLDASPPVYRYDTDMHATTTNAPRKGSCAPHVEVAADASGARRCGVGGEVEVGEEQCDWVNVMRWAAPAAAPRTR
jgi:hypothetical protein